MIQIHGKNYVTVAEMLSKAHKELKQISITTEILCTEPVVIKAIVMTPKGTFTGISAANASKMIEKESPYEVAETSAVGRALAFAGYETSTGIASAEEIKKAEVKERQEAGDIQVDPFEVNKPMKCPICNASGKYHKPDCPNKI